MFPWLAMDLQMTPLGTPPEVRILGTLHNCLGSSESIPAPTCSDLIGLRRDNFKYSSPCDARITVLGLPIWNDKHINRPINIPSHLA